MIITNRPPDLPFMIPKHSRLPGVAPVETPDWIVSPDDLNLQLQYRDALFDALCDHVLGLLDASDAPAHELLDILLAYLAERNGWDVDASRVLRPDGRRVAINRSEPMLTIGRLVSEDFCILSKPREQSEYVLVAAALCFPAGWSLADKMGRPMTEIHGPVPYYGRDLAKRVNRIFDGIRPEQILLRFNWSLPTSPELHAPPGGPATSKMPKGEPVHFLRVERQTLRRLPRTNAVAFGIRTTMTPIVNLRPEEAKSLLFELEKQDDEMTEYKDGSAHSDHAKAALMALSDS